MKNHIFFVDRRFFRIETTKPVRKDYVAHVKAAFRDVDIVRYNVTPTVHTMCFEGDGADCIATITAIARAFDTTFTEDETATL